MGVHKIAKVWTVENHRECFFTVEEIKSSDLRMPEMVLFDGTYLVKYNTGHETGVEFVNKQIVGECQPYFNNGAKFVFLIFDRHSPDNKHEEHEARYKAVVPYDVPEDFESLWNILKDDSEAQRQYQEADREKFLLTLFTEGLGGEASEQQSTSSAQSSFRSDNNSGDYYEDNDEDYYDNSEPVSTAAASTSLYSDLQYLEGDLTPEFLRVLQRRNVDQETKRRLVKSKLFEMPPSHITAVLKERGVSFLVYSDLAVPPNSKWKNAMSTPQLRSELMHYLTCKLVDDPKSQHIVGSSGVIKRYPEDYASDPLCRGYTPPEGKTLLIHGGMSRKPRRDRENYEALPRRDDSLIAISCLDSENGGGGGRRIRCVRPVDQLHPKEHVDNLGEGETACMYYSLFSPNRSQLIVSSDGDMMFLALLGSRHRATMVSSPKYNMNTPAFGSRYNGGVSRSPSADNITFPAALWVRLRVPYQRNKYAGKGGANSTDSSTSSKGYPTNSKSGDLYVDINTLYRSIHKKEPFRGCSEPVATYVAIMALIQCDFVKGFAPGLQTGQDSASKIPWLLRPMIEEPHLFRDMITMTENSDDEGDNSGASVRPPPNPDYSKREFHDQSQAASSERSARPCKVKVDRIAFRRYAYSCYLYKHRNTDAIKRKIKARMELASKKPEPPPFPDHQQTSPSSRSRVGRNSMVVESPFDGKVSRGFVDPRFARTKLSALANLVDDGTIIDDGPSQNNNNNEQDTLFYISVACIREHLSKSRSPMMSDELVDSYAASLEWLLSYWCNSYVGDCKYPHPCERVAGKPRYGYAWVDGSNGMCCRRSYPVSTPRENELHDNNKRNSPRTREESGRSNLPKRFKIVGGKGSSTSSQNVSSEPTSTSSGSDLPVPEKPRNSFRSTPKVVQRSPTTTTMVFPDWISSNVKSAVEPDLVIVSSDQGKQTKKRDRSEFEGPSHDTSIQQPQLPQLPTINVIEDDNIEITDTSPTENEPQTPYDQQPETPTETQDVLSKKKGRRSGSTSKVKGTTSGSGSTNNGDSNITDGSRKKSKTVAATKKGGRSKRTAKSKGK